MAFGGADRAARGRSSGRQRADTAFTTGREDGSGGLAPNMIWAVNEEGYRQTRKLADEEAVLITTHVAENHFELETSAA